MSANSFVLLLAGLLGWLVLDGGMVSAATQVENLGAHRLRGMDEFQRVLDSRCTVCHTRERVDVAIRERRSLEEIRQAMEARGAVLDPADKKVLGTFWGQPLKAAPAPSPVETPERAEFRRILETRCTLCHSLERVEEAIARRLPFATVEEILLQRGVVLTEQEREVLGTFWGSPMKE